MALWHTLMILLSSVISDISLVRELSEWRLFHRENSSSLNLHEGTIYLASENYQQTSEYSIYFSSH